MAFWASPFEPISTKPKPRDCPVSRSVMTATDSQDPACANRSSRSLLLTSKPRLPTYSFLPIACTPLYLGRRHDRVAFGFKTATPVVVAIAELRGAGGVPDAAMLGGVLAPDN